MKNFLNNCFFFSFLFFSSSLFAQDSTNAFQWKVSSKKLSNNQYELQFATKGAKGWQLYAPAQVLADVPTTELKFDSTVKLSATFSDSGNVKEINSSIFEGSKVRIYDAPTLWKQVITIEGDVPATLQGTLLYTYGDDDEFYPATSFEFSTPLEGGKNS